MSSDDPPDERSATSPEPRKAASAQAIGQGTSTRRALTSADRERTITLVSDGFAAGLFDVDELERRVTIAHTTEDSRELAKLAEDLGVFAAAHTETPDAPLPMPMPALIPARDVRPHLDVWAIMGAAQRRGSWTVPRELKITAIMGGCELDFREARFPEGTVDVHITAFMGGVQILVPPNLAVEMNGSAIMGGFDHVSRSRVQPDPHAPLLRIHGLAIMGGVEVKTRLPGESAWQARMRAFAESHLPAALDHLRKNADLWQSHRDERHARRAARKEARRLERMGRRSPPES